MKKKKKKKNLVGCYVADGQPYKQSLPPDCSAPRYYAKGGLHPITIPSMLNAREA
jgi:hypothetical protein